MVRIGFCSIALWLLASEPSLVRRELPFTLENSPTPEKYLIETMPGGVATFDYDNDGRPDLFFANGAEVPSLAKNAPKYFNRLLHNEGKGRFSDVTQSSGLEGEGYSIGVAAGDYDNDGNVDLFVTGVQGGHLYRNHGGGKFIDVTGQAGLSAKEWSVAAGWFDFDGDGQLDLFVVNYVQWDAAKNPLCKDPGGKVRVYCHPRNFTGQANRLYRNRGDGTFEDVTAASGIGKCVGKGMSLAIADYDGDGFPDVFVSNDTQPNFLFHNRGNGTFEEVAFAAGVALTDSGKAVSAMGVDFRDFDNDGLPDLMFTALTGETYPVFRNLGKGQFKDAGYATGLARLTARQAGWGIAMADFDNNGWKDIFTANSHVTDNIGEFSGDRYRLANSLFLGRKGVFSRDVLLPICEHAHRGLAIADFDGDGRLDVAVSALGWPAELWMNHMGQENRWLAVKLVGTRSNRDGIGAAVRVAGQINVQNSAFSYASSSLGPVHFGLGNGPAEQRFTVEITWPTGMKQAILDVPAGQTTVAKEAP